MTYDDAIKRIEQIVGELEQSEALSMEAYQAKAKEAKELLCFCQWQDDSSRFRHKIFIFVNNSRKEAVI